MTPDGLALLRSARETHFEGVAELFSDRYSDKELGRLARLLERLPA